jgi:lipoprotein-releasing system ATP-binding protein
MTTTMPNLVLNCSGLCKHFQQGDTRVEVLNGVDLQIAAGERIAIVGASGSGKTTLLQLMGGLDLPTAGTVSITGQEINRLSDAARGQLRNRALGFVYQFHHLLPEFTALENVTMPGRIRGERPGELRERARALLDEVGLSQRLTHRPGELSGGEQQRVALARALIMQPKLVLADEPTGNLDTNTGSAMHELLFRLNQAHRTTFLVVTHSQDLAQKMPRVVNMVDGRIESDQRNGRGA